MYGKIVGATPQYDYGDGGGGAAPGVVPDEVVAVKAPTDGSCANCAAAESCFSTGLAATHTVVKGETLSLISQNLDLAEWNQIYDLNKDVLSDPSMIDVGMRLALPQVSLVGRARSEGMRGWVGVCVCV